MVCFAVLAGLAAPAYADTWSVGYGVVPAKFDYVITNMAAKGVDTQGEDSFSLGVLNLQYEHDRKVSDSMHLVLATGIGFPIGTGSHDPTKELVNAPANSSKDTLNTGDSTDLTVLTVPVLIGAKISIPMGGNALAIGVSAGGMLVGMQYKQTSVSWAGTPPNETKSTTGVSYSSYVVPAYAILGSVGYFIRQGEGSALSIGATIGVIGQARNDTEITFETPSATQMKVEKMGGQVGGMTFGINVGWSKSF
jgi:hypothetical protein